MSTAEFRVEAGPQLEPIAADWATVSDRLAWSPPWLRITTADPTVRLDFVLARRRDRPVAGALRTWLDAPGWPMTDPAALLGVAPADASSPYPVAAYSLPAAYLPGLALGPGADPADLDALLDHCERADDAAGARLTAVLAVPPDDRDVTDALRRRGYVPFATASECVLPLAFDTFEGYLATLPQRKRTNARRERRAFAEAGLTVHEASIQDVAPEHGELIAAHLASYGHSDTAERMSDRLAAIRDNLGPRCLLLEARRGTVLVAFVVAYRDGTDVYPRVLGVDHAATEGSFAYFELVYYALIEAASALGARRILYGPESYRAKALRGCRPEARTSWVRALDPDVPDLAPAAEAATAAHHAELDAAGWHDLAPLDQGVHA